MKLLTYNICWNCMVPKRDSKKSTRDLGHKCFTLSTGDRKKENNICMRNVMDVLIKHDYDIIHTQETKNWDDLYEYLITKKPNYRYICLEANSVVYITTFYDKTKLELLGAKYVDFSSGRPVILAKFKDLLTGIEFIDINLHARHSPIDANIINNTEIYNMDTNIDIDGNLFKSNFKQNKRFDKSIKSSFKNLPIVLGGDTNDHGHNNYWSGIKLFDKILKCSSQPPDTCCTTINSQNYKAGYGDYFIYSDDFIEVKPNTMIPAKYPSSDHAPVDIELKFKVSMNTASNSLQNNNKNPNKSQSRLIAASTFQLNPSVSGVAFKADAAASDSVLLATSTFAARPKAPKSASRKPKAPKSASRKPKAPKSASRKPKASDSTPTRKINQKIAFVNI